MLLSHGGIVKQQKHNEICYLNIKLLSPDKLVLTSRLDCNQSKNTGE